MVMVHVQDIKTPLSSGNSIAYRTRFASHRSFLCLRFQFSEPILQFKYLRRLLRLGRHTLTKFASFPVTNEFLLIELRVLPALPGFPLTFKATTTFDWCFFHVRF